MNAVLFILDKVQMYKMDFISDAFRQAFFAKSGATENHIIDEDHQDPLQYDTLLHKKLRKYFKSISDWVLETSFIFLA